MITCIGCKWLETVSTKHRCSWIDYNEVKLPAALEYERNPIIKNLELGSMCFVREEQEESDD